MSVRRDTAPETPKDDSFQRMKGEVNNGTLTLCPCVACKYCCEVNYSYVKSHKSHPGTSLVEQCIGIRLPNAGDMGSILIQEDSTCHTATKPGRCKITEAHVPGAQALQQKKPPQ